MNLVHTALSGLFLLSGISGNQAAAVALPAIAMEAPPEPTAAYTVNMTAYNAVPEQTDSDPTTTASGARSNPEIVAARSVDLADELPWGTVIAVRSANGAGCGFPVVSKFIGYRVIADSMHPRKRNQIDILFDIDSDVTVGTREMNAAVAMGMCNNVKIEVVGRVDINKIPRTQRELESQISGLLAIKS